MNWSAPAIAVAVGWALNAELLLCIFLLSFLPFRARRITGYAIAILAYLVIIDWQSGNPLVQPELLASEALISNLAVMYFLKAFFIQSRSRLGRAMAINNYALACLFLISQVWLLWDGGDLEIRLRYAFYALLLWTVNMVITELIAPPPKSEAGSKHL